MKAIVLAAVSATLLAAPAFAADHAFVATGVTPDGEAVFFVDKTSIRSEAAWTKLVRIDVVMNGGAMRDGVKHSQSLVRIDCNIKMAATLANMTYDATGDRLSAKVYPGMYAMPFEDAYRQTIAYVCSGDGEGVTGKALADEASLLWTADHIYRQFPG